MAEQAAKEPSMEEILASIRKIISEDGDADAAPAVVPNVADDFAASTDFSNESVNSDVNVGDENDGHLLSVDDLLGNDVDFSEIDEFSDLEEAAPTESQAAIEDAGQEPLVDLEDELGALDDLEDLLDASETVSAPAAEPAYVPEPVYAAEPAPTPEPEPVIQQEPVMTPSPAPAARAQRAALTDDDTATAAAGSLGKLISTLDMGGDNTIEGLVRELLKPMIKDWLDSNLPEIVERKVEAEVQRIARMVG